MTKKDRFNEAFRYLRGNGFVDTQKDVAIKMGASAPNVSSALNGVEGVLTDRFLRRFNAAFGDVFNEKWLLTGEGEMLKNEPPPSASISGVAGASGAAGVAGEDLSRLLRVLESQQDSLHLKDEQISRLLDMLGGAGGAVGGGSNNKKENVG